MMVQNDGKVVRALASDHCDPGPIHSSGRICGLSLFGFYSEFSSFPLSTKINTFKFQFNLETVDEELYKFVEMPLQIPLLCGETF